MDSHGGWIASAIDLVRFASAFDDPAHCPLLKPVSIADMFARPIGAPGFDAEGTLKPAFYGLGWMARNDVGADAVHDTTTPGDRSTQWHTGSLDGTSTILVRRHDGLCWAVLFNTRNSVAENAPARLIDLLMHKTADVIQNWPQGEDFGPK